MYNTLLQGKGDNTNSSLLEVKTEYNRKWQQRYCPSKTATNSVATDRSPIGGAAMYL
jgi:hypothetical protein